MAQTTLDDFMANTCPRCGKAFKSERALKIHLTWHKNHDLYTVQRFFDQIEKDGMMFSAVELATFLKAVRDGFEEVSRAIEILSRHPVFGDLVEALKGDGASAWRSRATALLEGFIQSGCMDSVNNVIALYCEQNDAPKKPLTYVG